MLPDNTGWMALNPRGVLNTSVARQDGEITLAGQALSVGEKVVEKQKSHCSLYSLSSEKLELPVENADKTLHLLYASFKTLFYRDESWNPSH